MHDHRTRQFLGRALAAAFLDGAWTAGAMARRGRQALDPPPRWVARLAREVRAAYAHPPADRPRELAAYVAALLPPTGAAPRVRRMRLPPAAMGRRRWDVPELASAGDLGALLGLEPGALAWLCDVRGLERDAPDPRLRNYRYAWTARPDGPVRLLEQPKARLKAAQRTVLHEVLDRIPAHDAAHGFVRGRSVRTHAAAHAGREVVLRFDLEDFFAAIPAGRVFGVLRTAGYPEGVAHALTGLCTNVVSRAAWAEIPRPRGGDPRLLEAHHRLGRRLATPHLPQGAPTSPMLANLVAFRLDRRLSGLAAALGATYTRYADDLVLSGGPLLVGRAAGIRGTVREIARDEGFALQERKSQLMTRAGRQQVTGIVVNERPNLGRAEYDRLKAAVHQAVLAGPLEPEVRAHLLGRVAWLASLHPERGARLRRRLLEAS